MSKTASSSTTLLLVTGLLSLSLAAVGYFYLQGNAQSTSKKPVDKDDKTTPSEKSKEKVKQEMKTNQITQNVIGLSGTVNSGDNDRTQTTTKTVKKITTTTTTTLKDGVVVDRQATVVESAVVLPQSPKHTASSKIVAEESVSVVAPLHQESPKKVAMPPKNEQSPVGDRNPAPSTETTVEIPKVVESPKKIDSPKTVSSPEQVPAAASPKKEDAVPDVARKLEEELLASQVVEEVATEFVEEVVVEAIEKVELKIEDDQEEYVQVDLTQSMETLRDVAPVASTLEPEKQNHTPPSSPIKVMSPQKHASRKNSNMSVKSIEDDVQEALTPPVSPTNVASGSSSLKTEEDEVSADAVALPVEVKSPEKPLSRKNSNDSEKLTKEVVTPPASPVKNASAPSSPKADEAEVPVPASEDKVEATVVAADEEADATVAAESSFVQSPQKTLSHNESNVLSNPTPPPSPEKKSSAPLSTSVEVSESTTPVSNPTTTENNDAEEESNSPRAEAAAAPTTTKKSKKKKKGKKRH